MFCTPALTFLGVSLFFYLLNFFFGMQFSFLGIFVQLFFIFGWTFLLNYVCVKINDWISWCLIFAPFVFMLFWVLIIFEYAILFGVPMFSNTNIE